MLRRSALPLLCVGLLLAAAGIFGLHRWRTDFLIPQAVADELPADGGWHQVLLLKRAHAGRLDAHEIRVDAGRQEFRVEPASATSLRIDLRSSVLPQNLALRVTWRGKVLGHRLHFVADQRDSFSDGTPDFLRLHSPQDRQAFRDWFTAIARAEAELPPDQLPAEVDDCAALLRFSYRGALHLHDGEWLAAQHLMDLQDMASVRQYAYPHTPAGAALFRIRPGAFALSDLNDGSFAQFADARTLWLLNTHMVSRDVRASQLGDLLFFRQLEQNSPYHSMIVASEGGGWVVYHTGPIGKKKGEMRRVSMADLLHHPDVRWRPLPANSNFLGVYRWNILREGD